MASSGQKNLLRRVGQLFTMVAACGANTGNTDNTDFSSLLSLPLFLLSLFKSGPSSKVYSLGPL